MAAGSLASEPEAAAGEDEESDAATVVDEEVARFSARRDTRTDPQATSAIATDAPATSAARRRRSGAPDRPSALNRLPAPAPDTEPDRTRAPNPLRSYADGVEGDAAQGPGWTDLAWGIVRGIAGFRWLALGWAATVLFLTRADVHRMGLGVVLLGAAFVVTALATVGAITRHPAVPHPTSVLAELAVGIGLLLADGAVYDRDHSQTLGSAWPLAGVLVAAVVAGPIGGAAAGATLGLARVLGDWWSPNPPASSLALLSSAVLFTIAGGAAGAAVRRVLDAETAIAEARAREAVARTLHDGVLQTLAVVQRRSADGELAALARDQELELRAFLAGDHDAAVGLAAALRAAASRVERRDGLRVEVLVVDEDHPPVQAAVVEALAGAVGEALTNATKHGGAGRATVFVDVDDEVFCSVKDDGAGFDPATAAPGIGITRSIRGRLAEVGGEAEVDGQPGHGVEVRLRAPLRAPSRPARPGRDERGR